MILKVLYHVKLLKTMLVEMLGPDVSLLILRWNLVRSNLVFLHQFTNVEESQRDVLSSRTERTIANYMKCRSVVDVKRYLAELLTES